MGYSAVRWNGARVVEGARLESVCTGNRTESSNLSRSASSEKNVLKGVNPLGTFRYSAPHNLSRIHAYGCVVSAAYQFAPALGWASC